MKKNTKKTHYIKRYTYGRDIYYIDNIDILNNLFNNLSIKWVGPIWWIKNLVNGNEIHLVKKI